MKTRAVWNLSVSEDIPERMKTAKGVLKLSSFNNLLDYFLKAFEKQFADDIEFYKSATEKPELALGKPETDEHLFNR
ncbi:MAG: hypothetical protein LBU85_08780 [Treponema sp.]|jgi:hypothetical protein|nr:hypothetical protein [Treponema sp.]